MEFTTTERGARKLLKDGYVYLFKKNLANGITSWEYKLRRKGECRASVRLDELDNFVDQVEEHAHPPSATTCETTKIKENIKRRARDSLDNPRKTVSAKVQNVSEAVAVNLPSFDRFGRNIRSQRQNRHRHPNPNPRGSLFMIAVLVMKRGY